MTLANPRFVVAVTHGYHEYGKRVGCEAMVLDRWYCSRVVASFKSEDGKGLPSGRRRCTACGEISENFSPGYSRCRACRRLRMRSTTPKQATNLGRVGALTLARKRAHELNEAQR